jgi:hypothetical protein
VWRGRHVASRVAVGGPAALPLSTVPDKRQESKQRRAARNRANREALAARRDNAVISPTPTAKASSASAKAGSAKGTKGGTAARAAAGSGPQPPPKGIMGMLQSKRPGDKAVLAAFALAVVAAGYLLFYKVPADDRGEPLPAVFRGLAVAARERLTGQPMADNQVSLLDASGPQIFLVLALPIAVTGFALWANRRADRSRMLTFAMLAMAGSVILTGGIGIFFFPALIALAVGGFRVRKSDLPARTAERATGGGLFGGGLFGRGRGPVIDADSAEVTDEDAAPAAGPGRSRRTRRGSAGAGSEPADEVVEVGEVGEVDAGPDDVQPSDVEPVDVDVDAPADPRTDADDTAAADDEGDPLAELEAELEAEREAETTTDGDAGDGGSRRKRR